MARLMLFLPSLAGGGAERVMLELAAGFVARGHETIVAVGEEDGPLRAAVDGGCEVVSFGRSRVTATLLPLAGLIRRRRPDAILSAMTHANVISVLAAGVALTRATVVVSEHSAVRERVMRARGLFARGQYRIAARLYPHVRVVAVSRGVADDLTTTLGVPRDRISVVYNPARAEPVTATDPPPHPWLSGPFPVVIGAGRLVPEKGFDLLIRAFATVRAQRDARLIILGEGMERAALLRLASELGIETDVTLPGFVDDPRKWMAHASAVALPSRREGFGLVLVEALAAGAPIAAFDCPWGPSEILEGGRYGHLARPEDAGALAVAIEAALVEGRPEDAVERRRERASDFSSGHAVDGYLRLMVTA